MKLSVKSLTIAAGVVWALGFLWVAVFNIIRPPYGQAFLEMMRSVYPGYKMAGGLRDVVVGTLYALVDGGVAGLLFGWIYNLSAPK